MGRDCRVPPKGQNSQATGPFPDRPLESVESVRTTDEAISQGASRRPAKESFR